jgi:hypothetical protein
MHREVKQFVREVKSRYPSYFKRKKVLEVGSQDINGSVRRFFSRCDYLGIDLGPGKGVDMIAHATDLVHPNYYDVVISTEALEHDKNWKASVAQMWENLKPGGLLIITCASVTRAEHGTKRSDGFCSPFTQDYYGNISTGMFMNAMPMKCFTNHLLEQRRNNEDLVFYGIKS